MEWGELPMEKARGLVTQYQVHYRKSGSSSQLIVDVPGHLRHYTITGLESNQKYDARVLAATTVGFPILHDREWPWVSQITDPSLRNGGESLSYIFLKGFSNTDFRT